MSIAQDSKLQTPVSVSGLRLIPRIQSAMHEREALAMSQQMGISPLLARIVVGRGMGIDDAEDFLNPSLKASLPDPSHLLDMDKAASRICRAIDAGETIAVFGDYDVDGATSSALLKRYFAALGIEILVYIPDRMKEGYGPNIAAFESLKAQGATLIITVDCGTVSMEPIAAIAAQGVDVIVVDHHMALPELPAAHAVVNPNRIDQDSPLGHLAAVGVTFMLLVALNRVLRDEEGGKWKADNTPPASRLPLPDLMQFLDLVALGTVCDVVSLTGLNRAFVAQGLKVMAKRQNVGLAVLSDIARLDEAPTSYHAGFLLGPRINAGGRVGASDLGSKLLASSNAAECAGIAQQLDAYNAERQAIEAMVLEQALEHAERQANMPCIIVAQQGWHEGVIGIVAGRLKEAYNRPALVIALADGKGKGSGRSVSGADLGAAITSAKLEGLLLAGGGHAMAAGFSLEEAQLPAFIDFMSKRLENAVADYQAGRSYLYDANIAPSGINLSLLSDMERAGPFGMGNPAPRLLMSNVRIYDIARMKDKHLRLTVGDASGDKARVKAVCFNCVGSALGDALENHGGRVLTLAGQLKRNRYQGYESAQFIIDDAALA